MYRPDSNRWTETDEQHMCSIQTAFPRKTHPKAPNYRQSTCMFHVAPPRRDVNMCSYTAHSSHTHAQTHTQAHINAAPNIYPLNPCGQRKPQPFCLAQQCEVPFSRKKGRVFVMARLSVPVPDSKLCALLLFFPHGAESRPLSPSTG